MEILNISIKGLSPILLHSDRYANPLDPGAKAHKVLTGKRVKTDEDHAAIAESEWRGGLYFSKGIGVYLPTANIRSCIVEGAKLSKLGKAIQRGTIILFCILVIYFWVLGKIVFNLSLVSGLFIVSRNFLNSGVNDLPSIF